MNYQEQPTRIEQLKARQSRAAEYEALIAYYTQELHKENAKLEAMADDGFIEQIIGGTRSRISL